MAERQRTTGQAMINKRPHILKIEQHEPN